MIRDKKNIWIRNVHFFVKRIKNLMIIKKVELIRQNFNICFRNYAFIWYIIQFINLKRKILRTMKSTIDNKKRWIIQLKKFRFIYSNALNNF